MILPALADDAFLADVAAARTERGLHLWWLGQSGFLMQWQERHVLMDPYLSDSLTKKYAATDKPHVRVTKRVVAPERLDFIDVVASSHLHTDHFDPETLLPLLRANPALQIIIPEANRAIAAERLGVSAEVFLGLEEEASIATAGLEIHGVPAAHESLDRQFLGYVVRCGEFSVYHSGDTVLYDGMVERLRKFALDIALLPINGRAPERRVAGNLWGREAAQLARDIGARLAIPMHYDMFTFNTASPEEFESVCRRIGQPYRVLRCGERFRYPPSR